MTFRFLPTPLAAVFVLVLGVPAALAKLTPQQIAQLPAPATRPIDFAKDIQPIFEASCVQCHARGKSKGNFSLETRADWLEGGDAGAPAIAGKSAESYVVELISGLDPEIVMPQKGKKLTRDQVAVFRAWIDQGMKWPENITFFKHEPANLRPREIATKIRSTASSMSISQKTKSRGRNPSGTVLMRVASGWIRWGSSLRPRNWTLSSPIAARTNARSSCRACSPTTSATPSTG